ncbi:MAG: hypothetical protein A2150_07615 [Candidatus Muproteobacteria bacterium RBG_16_64_11]|uniref:Xaa-Pro dipeptidyl-peptidase-like domain-containing protein n=1 Tax=Candidatus Muproteobacteria bacterium RBG_16_64_11 TaxID=1817758 RepID=A0A1F6TA20_9PROT|nr:MAG: hypothetical protein A2150_07615 [Candidatus Muproteobacteria bacterium RBG_16_64_11]
MQPSETHAHAPFRRIGLLSLAVVGWFGGLVGTSGAVHAVAYLIEAAEKWIAAPNGAQLYTRVVQPSPALYPGQRFPALIAIPGGTGAGAPLADNPLYRNLAASGFVVTVFNAEGRGSGRPGDLVSQGAENCNGYAHQDDLKAVIEHAAALTNVDVTNIGVETASLGIAIGAGALGRYPDLPVAYLVDQEGPHDNRVITFYDAGRERAVCGHMSTVTDPSAANQAFWAEREAVRHIGGFRGRYLRMQAEADHAQNPGYFRHAIEMVNAAAPPLFGGAGSAAWTRMNGGDLGNPVNTAYSLSNPAQYPKWVAGRLSDHPGLNTVYVGEMAALAAASTVFLRINGNPYAAVTAANPVTVGYTIRGGQGRELFLTLDAPAMNIPLSYRSAAGQWIPLPANLADVTPFAVAPADGDHTLYTGTVPAGAYSLCLGYDPVANGHLDTGAAVSDCVSATVR